MCTNFFQVFINFNLIYYFYLQILARDRRLGLDVQSVGNEPMDTIFVKNVRDNSPASVAGLTTGDRIISVNGEDIAGLSYARVIQLIHKTGNYLHLLVVPKENDILQLVSINCKTSFHSSIRIITLIILKLL